jgi:hypothetical protein
MTSAPDSPLGDYIRRQRELQELARPLGIAHEQLQVRQVP